MTPPCVPWRGRWTPRTSCDRQVHLQGCTSQQWMLVATSRGWRRTCSPSLGPWRTSCPSTRPGWPREAGRQGGREKGGRAGVREGGRNLAAKGREERGMKWRNTRPRTRPGTLPLLFCCWFAAVPCGRSVWNSCCCSVLLFRAAVLCRNSCCCSVASFRVAVPCVIPAVVRCRRSLAPFGVVVRCRRTVLPFGAVVPCRNSCRRSVPSFGAAEPCGIHAAVPCRRSVP